MLIALLILVASTLFSGTTTLDTALYQSTLTSLSANNSLLIRGKSSSRVVFDGGGGKLFFPANDNEVIVINKDKTLVMQNVTLVGFRPSHFKLMSATSLLLLGNGVVVSLESDLDLSKTMTVAGNVSIFGNNSIITIPGNSAFVVTKNASLEFNNCKLRGLGNGRGYSPRQEHSIMCDNSAKLRLKSTVCCLDYSWSFTSGSLEIEGDTLFKGRNTSFVYNSGNLLVVKSESTMAFGRGTTFWYASKAGRYKFNMVDATSRLFFDGGKFLCGDSGLTISSGQLFLKGDVPFSTTSLDSGKGFILDDSLLTVILSNSSLLVDGIVAHGRFV